MVAKRLIIFSLLLFLCLGLRPNTLFSENTAVLNPSQPGPCSTAQYSTTHNSIDLEIIYPTNCNLIIAPFPAIIFAHGFTLFGFSDGVAANIGNGEHLASWGYITVLPTLPDDFNERLGVVLETLSFLEIENENGQSPLNQAINLNKLATSGHSLGGGNSISGSGAGFSNYGRSCIRPGFPRGGVWGRRRGALGSCG